MGWASVSARLKENTFYYESQQVVLVSLVMVVVVENTFYCESQQVVLVSIVLVALVVENSFYCRVAAGG